MPRFADRARERFETITGFTIRDAKDVALQETEYQRSRAIIEEAEDLAMGVMDYVHGEPHEVTHEKRRELSQRSRIAFIRDPLAGAEAEMRSNFAFGRGVPIPQAQDPDVQRIVDRAWKDPINRKKLTGFEAQRHRSNELITQANLIPAVFENNGRVRVAFVNFDTVSSIVCHSEDDEMPLWYVSRKKKRKWDYEQDHAAWWESGEENGVEKVIYHQHWRNVDIVAESGLDEEKPDDSKIAPGRVEHFRINRVGRTQFGTPPWARVLRFFSAMNQFTEARVSMAQAAASIIATNTVKGGPTNVLKAAGNIIAQTGEIAAARFGRRNSSPRSAGPGTNPAEGLAPPPAGSFWGQNEAQELRALNLSSGGGEAISDRQLIAAPISAAAQFGQHWLGDPSATNMATATTLELPALMAVGAWQETFEEIFRWFTNRAIEAAIKSGELGGMVSEADDHDDRSLQDLIYEEDLEELEKRTGKDLSYAFEMPYPGRRNLPDVINVANAVAAAYDPEGKNPWLRRKLLDFLFRHGLQTEDPAKDVDDVMPMREGEEAPEYPLPEEEAEPEAEGGGKKVERNAKPNDEKSQRGEARRSTPPSREMGGGAKEGELAEAVEDELARTLAGDVDREFQGLLDDPTAFLSGRAPTRTPESSGASAAAPLR